MHRVTFVRALDGFRLSIGFDDGKQGTVALESRLFGPVFEPLRDSSKFQQVFIDEFGAVAWPTGADLAPDALYETISSGANVAVDV